MRTTRWLLATLAILAVAVVSVGIGLAQAPAPQQPPAGRMGYGPPQGPPRFPFEQLGLTDQQKQEIQALMQAQRQNPPGTDLMQLERDLHKAIFLGTGNVEDLKARIIEAEKANLERRIAHQTEIARILTPDQRQKMADMPMPGPGRGGMGRGMMMGGRGAGR